MLALRPAWEDLERTWVTLRGTDSEQLLAGEHVIWAHGPTNRSLAKLLANAGLAARVIARETPDAVLSTGAALAVPFIAAARLTGRRAVFVESFTRVHDLSLSGRIVYPIANVTFAQWPAVAGRRRRARYEGSVL